MKLYSDKLDAHLAKGQLAPIYLVAGDEPLQSGEAADAIRGAARRQGYDSREVFFAERSFDWNGLLAAGNEMSLFAAKRIIELRLPTGKPGDQGAKVLQELAERPPEDAIVLIISAKVDGRAKWVKALEKAGVQIDVWPIDAAQMPRWVQQRFQSAGIAADAEAARLLAEKVEGNLLAADQEIRKLQLLLEGKQADAEAVRAAVADSARYDVFGLLDAALAGDRVRALRMLEGLRGEGVEPVIINWAFARDVQMLLQMSFQLAAGIPMSRVTSSVWPRKREPLVQRVLGRLKVGDFEDLLLDVAAADQVIKGARAGDRWMVLHEILLKLSGTQAARGAA